MSVHDEIEEARRAAQPEAEMLRAFRQYARGRQRGTLTTDQGRALRGLLGNLFCDNVCKRVLQEQTNRLRIARFEVADEAVLEYLKDLWTLNKLPKLAPTVLYSMLRDGDVAVGLALDGTRVRLARELWWNGKRGTWIAYGADERPAYAVKDWHDGTRARRTIWYPERIERYALQGEGWQWFSLASDPGGLARRPGPVPWTTNGRADGEPLGIPIVHFANAQTPNDGPGDGARDDGDASYGASELDGGVLGLQDEINDVQRDLSAAGRFTAYQQLYATGVTMDEDGNPPYRPAPGAMYQETNPDARFGYIPAGSVEQLLALLNAKHETVARMTQVPAHLIAGEWPSGEALLRAERPLNDKAETLAEAVGASWASVAHKATRLANAFEGLGLDEEAMIATVFRPVGRGDALTQVLVAEKQAPFVSLQETLRTLGKSPDQIAQILAERAEEARMMADPLEEQRRELEMERARVALEADRRAAADPIAERLALAGAGLNGGGRR